MHFVWRITPRALPGLFRQGTFLLLSSRNEIYGMVVLEAMYFGLSVISNRTAGPESLIDSGHDGIFVDDLTVDTWRRTIAEGIATPDRRLAMSVTAQKKVASQLTWDVIARRYLNEIIIPGIAICRSYL